LVKIQVGSRPDSRVVALKDRGIVKFVVYPGKWLMSERTNRDQVHVLG